MEEDSDDSDEYDQQQQSRKSSGLGDDHPKKPYRDSGYNKDSHGQQRGVQKDWQRRVDNYGYIERKTYTKSGEEKASSAAFKGKAYYVKVDAEPAQDPRASHKRRETRERTPEYREKD